MNKVIIAGGSGFLGNALTEHFLKNNYEVIILSRSRESNSSFLLWLNDEPTKTFGDISA